MGNYGNDGWHSSLFHFSDWGQFQNTQIDFSLWVIWHITLWNRELVIYQTLGVYNTHSGLLHITPLQRPGCYWLLRGEKTKHIFGMSKHIPWGMHNSGSELTISNTKSNGDTNPCFIWGDQKFNRFFFTSTLNVFCIRSRGVM